MLSTDETYFVSVPFLQPSFGTVHKLSKQTNQQLCNLATKALATKYAQTHESMQADFSFKHVIGQVTC